MTRGVEYVYAVAAVFELQDRGGYRDSSLLLYLHPVRNGVTRGALALDRTGEVDGSAVKQQLFGQGSFARVRVRDDGEGSAFCYFFL